MGSGASGLDLEVVAVAIEDGVLQLLQGHHNVAGDLMKARGEHIKNITAQMMPGPR